MRRYLNSLLLAAIATSSFSSALAANAAAPASSAADPATAPAAAGATVTAGRAPRGEIEIVTVLGKLDRTDALPGSHQTLDSKTLSEAHVMTTSEALRKVAGVNVRDEEGFGLRPNIGMRGLNPTRSTKTLLLEDGIPLAYAPYGDNASYYHPPIDRFARIEVLKGAATNLFGPQTVGGVINYITPTPTAELAGMLRLTAGDRGYRNLHARASTHGIQLDVVDKRGDGARDHINSVLGDYNAKLVTELGTDHTLIVRANRYIEDSDITYSGITDAELARFGPRYNPFANDTFDTSRSGFSATHAWAFGTGSDLTTSVYSSRFARDWWRQGSTTSDSQCNAVTYAVNGNAASFAAARAAGVAVNANDCNSRQGRLRDYDSRGIEPRLRLQHALLGDGELLLGARVHEEKQRRRQVNAVTPTGRTGATVEDNERDTRAWSAFVQNRFLFGDVEIAPGLRYEHIANERRNALTRATGNAEQSEWLPGLGLSWQATPTLSVFGGIHKGFAPPRTEDLIDNSGAATDVDAESSINIELGARAQLADSLSFDATLFRNQFDNQIAVGSIAGGSTPLAQGEARYAGIEVAAAWSREAVAGAAWTPYVNVAWTYLPTADIEQAFRRVDTGALIAGAVAGNRLPYAPEHLLTTSVGARFARGLDAHVEFVYVGEQFTDFAGTRAAPVGGNGQIGRIDSYRIWNASLNWQLPTWPVTLFATVKNVADDAYIVDRTRGILTAPPRLVQAGVEVTF